MHNWQGAGVGKALGTANSEASTPGGVRKDTLQRANQNSVTPEVTDLHSGASGSEGPIQRDREWRGGVGAGEKELEMALYNTRELDIGTCRY